MSIEIKWCQDRTAETTETIENIFVLDEKKSWKGKSLRGHDIAEMIADTVWDHEHYELDTIRIVAPATYAGVYRLSVKFEPTFMAKRVDI